MTVGRAFGVLESACRKINVAIDEIDEYYLDDETVALIDLLGEFRESMTEWGHKNGLWDRGDGISTAIAKSQAFVRPGCTCEWAEPV